MADEPLLSTLETAVDDAAGELTDAARRWHDNRLNLSAIAGLLHAAATYGELCERRDAAWRDALRDTFQPWIRP